MTDSYPRSLDIGQLDAVVDRLIEKVEGQIAAGEVTINVSPERMREFGGNIARRLEERLSARNLPVNTRTFTGHGHSGVIKVLPSISNL